MGFEMAPEVIFYSSITIGNRPESLSSRRRHQLAYVGEFHALGVRWGAPEGPDESLRTEETVQFWEHDLPLQMADLAAQLDPGHRFDSIVVDEAQDFADPDFIREVGGPDLARRLHLPST